MEITKSNAKYEVFEELLEHLNRNNEYLVITKEIYTDGVSSIYENTIEAKTLEEATSKAKVELKLRNQHLDRHGQAFLICVRDYT